MNNEVFIDDLGVQTIGTWVNGKFATKTEAEAIADDLDTLSDRVEEIIAEGGEPNTIETVKVNGTALTPDANKAVDVTVPTSTSDLTNDGDGTSNFATESYVDTNGGKIDKIKVNGTEQTITNKEVDITVPTSTSDLTNDSNFIDATVNNLTNYYTKFQTYTQSEVDNLISAAKSGRFVPVATLPTASAETMGAIYLVPKQDTETRNVKDEYITIEVTGGYDWEHIGDTQVDLSNYWNSTNLRPMTTAEINAILEPTP